MKQVRHGVFETNSSSTHAICIPNECKVNLPKTLYFNFGEFGWENGEADPSDYLYTAIWENCSGGGYLDEEGNSYLVQIEEWLREEGCYVKFQEKTDDEWYPTGYIDHSYDLQDFIHTIMNDKDMFLRYVSNGIVITGNDNTDSEYNPAVYRIEKTLYDWDTKQNKNNPNCDIDPEKYYIYEKGN